MSVVTEIRLYGNGKVALNGGIFGYHHVFVVVTMGDKTFRLLELTRGDGSSGSSGMSGGSKISIRQKTAISVEAAVEERSDRGTPAEKWGDTEPTTTPWGKIQKVIDSYHGKKYDITSKNCRTFADELHTACGVKKCCND